MSDSVGDLWQKIADLDEKTRLLRVESNSIVGFVPDDSGQPVQVVTNQDRFKEIGEEFKRLASEKAKTEAKLAKIEGILGENGDGCLAQLSGYKEMKSSERLRLEMKQAFVKMLGFTQPFRLPSEIMATPEYKELADRIDPEITRLENQAKSNRELSQKVMQIILS